MPKYTKGTPKGVPEKSQLFSNQQIALSSLQDSYQELIPLACVPSSSTLCPALLRCRVEAKQAEKEAKRQINLVKQRERRLSAKLLGSDCFPADAVLVVTPEGLQVDQAPAALAAPAPVAPAPAPRISRPMAELAEAVAPLEEVWKRSRRAKKRRESADELLVHTIDVTPPHLQGREKAKKMRSRCLETGKMLTERGEIAKPLLKAGKKIMNCGVWGLYQSHSNDVNYKTGTALCKCRVCPNCTRVVAAKRRGNALEWWEGNRPALRGYFFYHLVLTVRHSAAEGVRTNLYTGDLLSYFAQLRGTHVGLSGYEQRTRSARWKHFVAGGTYSVEVKQGRDTSPHIHIHCLLVAKVQLYNRAKDSEFLQHIRPLWLDITGDSDNVFIEPTYYLHPETREKVYAFKGSDAKVEHAVAECMKYTIKADAADLAGYSDDFLSQLLTMRNRYYGRFGCLSANDKTSGQFAKLELLCTDYQDLEQVTEIELARLLNPETGEVLEPEDTRFVATPNRNMTPVAPGPVHQPVELETVKMVPSGRFWPADGSALAGTAILEARVVRGEQPQELPNRAPEIYYRAAELPDWQARAQYHFFPYQERQKAAIWLSRSIAADYNPAYELAENSI